MEIISFSNTWMPPPGPDFVALARSMYPASEPEPPPTVDKRSKKKEKVNIVAPNIEVIEDLYRQALYQRDFVLPVSLRDTVVQAKFLPGHVWCVKYADGPRQASVMVIGKNPGRAEVLQGRNFCGEASEPFHEAVHEIGIPDDVIAYWYFTNVVKHTDIDPQATRLSAAVIRNCKPLLQMELSLIRPDYVLIMGAEAAAVVLDRAVKLTDVFGEVLELPIPHIDDAGQTQTHIAKAMVVTHPAAAFHNPDSYDDWRDGLMYFYRLVCDGSLESVERDIHHEVITDDVRLREVVDMVVADPDGRIIAVDCEWEGAYPTEPNAYLRTVQFSHKPKHAFVIRLHDQHFYNLTSIDGAPATRSNLLPCVTPDVARAELNRLLKSTDDRKVRVGGHYFRADMPWLIHFGVDIRDEYFVGGSDLSLEEAAEKTRDNWGWDTHSMAHAADETSALKLELQGLRRCGVPRYDIAVLKAKTAHQRANKLVRGDVTGYGFMADEVLEPYAAYDADNTRRLFDAYNGVAGKSGILDSDKLGRSCRLAYYLTAIGAAGLLEIEMDGMRFYRNRFDELVFTYMDVLGRLKRDLAQIVGWDRFNSASAHHRREWLFGIRYAGKKGGGSVTGVEPLQSLALPPVKTAGKSGMAWEVAESRGLDTVMSPSTDSETLGILLHMNPVVGALRDVRIVEHLLNTSLRRPGAGYTFNTPEDLSDVVYEKGLASWVDAYSAIRTHLSPVETGRDSSWKPPLQNIAQRREEDYQRIAGDQYLYPVRSVLGARPGHVLIDCDIKSAELAAIGWLAQDPNMQADVARNLKKKSDPDFLDIHSMRAVQAFCLDCEPTEAGLASIGRLSLRTAAKNVNFGIPYGRQAEAIARQCREKGNPIDADTAEVLIRSYFDRYRQIEIYLRRIEDRVAERGWICGGMGRLRRFNPTRSTKKIAEQQRSGKNFPIQNLVAEALRIIKRNLVDLRNGDASLYRLAMVIHDAVTLEVPIQQVGWVLSYVLPMCFIHRLPIWPYDMDGNKIPIREPYRFGYDVKISQYWGVPLTKQEAQRLGLPENAISLCKG